MDDKTDNRIKKLWKKMEDELAKLDPHDDWPEKSIVMRSPWHLEIHSYHEAWDEHETVLDFVRREAIRKEDFDESSLPPELLKYAKAEILYDDDKTYPNIISATASGDTLEEAIEEMRKKLHLLEDGYILMDTYSPRHISTTVLYNISIRLCTQLPTILLIIELVSQRIRCYTPFLSRPKSHQHTIR